MNRLLSHFDINSSAKFVWLVTTNYHIIKNLYIINILYVIH